jgi:hypothetical protein
MLKHSIARLTLLLALLISSLSTLSASELIDTDGDEVGDNSDAFPTNPNESLDMDGDGLGNNDDDNDQLIDTLEIQIGTDPQTIIVEKGDINNDGQQDVGDLLLLQQTLIREQAS